MKELKVSFHALASQVRFFYEYRVVPIRQLFLSLLLSIVVLVSEALGIASIFPIVSFLEHGRDITEFTNASKINALFIQLYDFFSIKVSLLAMIFVTVFLVVLRQVSNFFFSYHSERLKWSLGINLGEIVLKKMLESKAHFINKISRGNLIVSIDYECQAIATIILVYIMMFQLVMSLLAYLSLSFYTSPVPTVLSAFVLCTVALLLGFLIKRINKLSAESVERRQEFTNLISEVYGAWKIIKLNSTEKFELARFKVAGTKLVDLRTKMTRTSSKIELIFVPVITSLLLGSVYLMVEILQYPVASITIYLASMTRMMPMAQNFQKRFVQLAQYDPSLEKISDLLVSSERNLEITETGADFQRLYQSIKFEDVTFRYEKSSKDSLTNVNFELTAGTVIAIVGRSGAGKTTLTDLITGLIRPSEGKILIDGQQIEDYSLASIRERVSVVNQDTFLFNATILENLNYGNGISGEDEIWKVLRAVDLEQFVLSLPNGLNSEILDSAKNISGGQKQRLSIARAILKKANILILDEPTSALDSISEKIIFDTLRNMVTAERATVLIVTHNFELARKADLVLQLKDGKVDAFGYPDDVLTNHYK